MASRQTEANRRQSLATLRARLLHANILTGVEVDYEVNRGFRIQLHGVTFVAGRYEVVYAWLDGFLRGLRDGVNPDQLSR